MPSSRFLLLVTSAGVEDDSTSAPKEADESNAPSSRKHKVGALLAPVRMVTTTVRKAANAKTVEDSQAPELINRSAISGNFRTPKGRIISAEELCASADRTPVWLHGNFKTQSGATLTAEELCASLERMHTAKSRKDQQGSMTGAGAAIRSDQDLQSLIQEMYISKVISEGDEGRLVRVERVVMGDRELWVPVGQSGQPAQDSSAGDSASAAVADDQSSGGAAPLPRTMVDTSKVVWQVMWDDGTSGEFVVGTEASHSCLRVAGSIEGLEPPIPQALEAEHFVRMLEPVLLVDTGSRIRNRHLARLADALAGALQW